MKQKRHEISSGSSTANTHIKFNQSVLENGVTIISEEIPSVESFSLGIAIGVGSREDEFDKPGTAHFLEHAVYRRTKTRTSRQISNQFDSMGAYSNAYTTKEMTLFYVRATKQHFLKTMDLLADIIINPVFKQAEINKERQIIIEEIKSYDDDPEEYVFDLADSAVFPNHQLGAGIDGTINSLKKIDCDVLSDFHQKHYSAPNIVIAMAGNIKHETLVEAARLYFDCLPTAKSLINRVEPIYCPTAIAEHKAIQQSHLILGKQICGANDKSRYAVALLNIIFGDGLSSRIYQTLREKQGLAYSVFSNLNLYSDVGSIFLYIATDKNNLSKSEDLLYFELSKLNTKRVTKTEILRAKEQLKTAKILEFESMSARMQSLVKNHFMLNGYETLNQTISAIDAVTIEDLVELSELYYNPNNWCRIALIPKQ